MELYRSSVIFIISFIIVISSSKLCLGINNNNNNNEVNEVKVTIRGATSIGKTDDSFICATLDWWPSNKCNYNQCPWGKAGILNLDLRNKILNNAVKALSPLRIRVGGSLQDQVFYNVRNPTSKCQPFSLKSDGLFGFSKGCFHMQRWDELAQFFGINGALVTFGLNALVGREKVKGDDLYIGDWNYQNAQDFINYNIFKGHKIDSYELGNELCGTGVSARIEAEQYAKDMVVLKEIVKKLYPNPITRPKVLGPGGFFDEKWFTTFLQESGPNVVEGLTHHIYNLGAGVDKDLINKVQDPNFLTLVAQTYKDVSRVVDRFGPWSGAWVGESGGAFNSGGKNVSNTFADGYWYLDQLGMTASLNHKVFCRQTLIGGNYGLLDTNTFIPNPDFYGALLWHRLMGSTVLATTHTGSPYLRTYSHCSKTKPGVTLLLINMSNSTTFNIDLVNDHNLFPEPRMTNTKPWLQEREEYHITPKDGNIQSNQILLNGELLSLTQTSDIPEMKPVFVTTFSPIKIAPHSYVFVTIRNLQVPACNSFYDFF
ncbi:heparanase-like protein 1 [Chenopodium quinoa]|uniref:heparanase-like protein 1 n=1 Tax=Chenopodium quinoa TaxID=63459 RepID=UPI000B793C86|nr:heparanase-like protein 1 [Chenopodium quinoa]